MTVGPRVLISNTHTQKTFSVFLDLFAFLSSIRGFPDAFDSEKIKF